MGGGPSPAVVRMDREVERTRGRTCGKHAHMDAVWPALSYLESCGKGAEGCEDSAAQRALALFKLARQWQECSDSLSRKCIGRCTKQSESKVRFAWLEPSTMAWEWIRSSRVVSVEDRREVESLLGQMAESLWPPIDFGAINRSISLASSFSRLSRLIPEHPRAAEWRDYSKRVWDHVVENGGFGEDSASYEVDVVWPGLLQLSAEMSERDRSQKASGAPGILDQPAFRQLLDRLFDHTAPMGFLPGYGDTSAAGFASPGQIWLFEEAANHYRDPRYRWLADRLREFRSERIPAGESNRLWYLALADRARRRADIGSRMPISLSGIDVSSARTDGSNEIELLPGNTTTRRIEVPGDGLTGLRLQITDASTESTIRVEVEPLVKSSDPDLVRMNWSYDETLPVSAGALDLYPFFPGVRDIKVQIQAVAGRVRLAAEGSVDATDSEISRGDASLGGIGDVHLGLSVLRGEGSTITRRREVRLRPRQEWGHPKSPWEFTGREVPDKLVLRSGFNPNDLFALIDLVSGQSHDSAGVGGLVSLVHGQTVLLSPAAIPYWRFENHVRHANSAVFEGPVEAPSGAAETLEFHDSPQVTVAHLRWDRDQRSSHERRVVFVKNRLIWVRDRLERVAAQRASVGVNWHAQQIAEVDQTPSFWLSTPSIWHGAYRIGNPSADLFLHVPLFEGLSVRSAHAKEYDRPDRCPESIAPDMKRAIDCIDLPNRLIEIRHVEPERLGEPGAVWIDSLLVPVSGQSASRSHIRVSRSGKEGSASWLELELGDERWLLIDNPEEKLLRSDTLETDARTVVALLGDGDRNDSVNASRLLSVRSARLVRHEGFTRRFGARSSIESGRVLVR